jgi:HEAT repeat protein
MMGREAVISQLSSWLEKGNEADRFYAVRTLSKINAEQVSEQLIARLGDEDDDVCTEAATALGKLACIDAVPVLKEAVGHHDLGDVRIAATAALSAIASDDAIDTLMELAQSRPEGLDQDSIEGWDDYWDIQRAAVIALGEHHVDKAVPLLMSLLTSDDCDDLEPEILTALAKCGEQGITFLLSCLPSSSNRSVRRIVKALAITAAKYHPVCLANLIELLSNSDAHIRLEACKTLGHFALVEAIEPLGKHFVDNNTEVAEAAIRAVINIASKLPNGLKMLTPHMLLSLAKDTESNAQKALLKIADEMTAHANAMTKADHQFLAHLFKQEDQELTLLAAKLLFAEKNDNYQQVLIQLFSDQSLVIHIRRELIQCYGKHIENSEQAIAPLLGLLNEDDNIVRTTALELIAKTAGKSFNEAFNPAERALYFIVINKQEQQSKMVTNNVAAEQVIPVTVIDDRVDNEADDKVDNEANVKNKKASDNSSFSSPKAMDELLADVEQNIGTANIDVDTEEEKVVTSTLASIGAVSVKPITDRFEKEADQDQRLRKLLAEQEGEMSEFNDIVEDHLQSSDKLGYSKKKIARIAKIDNQILAAQALAHYPVKPTVQLILESLRSPNIEMTVALLTALDRIVLTHSQSYSQSKSPKRIQGLSNIVGICSTLLFAGNNDIKRLAAKILGQLKHRQAIPALQSALGCEDQNVRIQAINSLSELISKKAKRISIQDHVVRDENEDESRDEKSIRLVINALEDKEYGVRRAAITFIERHKIPLIEKLVDLGCVDGGALAGDVGHALKTIDKAQATQVILSRLEGSDSFSQRQYLFQQIECIYDTHQVATT